MTIATFQQRVSRAVKRGNVFDKDIPGYAKDAVRTLENINNWKHMWVETEGTLLSGVNTLAIPNLKSVRYLQEKTLNVSSVATYRPIYKVSSEVLLAQDATSTPDAFWMKDLTTLQLDATLTEDMDYRIGYYVYSTYDDALPWLDIAEGLLLAQTISEMSPLLRDDKLVARFGPIAQGKLAALEEQNLVHEFDGQQNKMIPYADEVDDYFHGSGPLEV